MRALTQAAAIAVLPRPEAIWTSAGRELAPFLWSQSWNLRRPMVLDLDWTFAQQEELAPLYFSRPARKGWRYVLGQRAERYLWSKVTLFSAWSQWAADSLHRGGVDSSRIVVNPPGVDLNRFRPGAREARPDGDPLRLLFVGGDFARKGGDLLLAVVRSRFADRCLVDVVTRDNVAAGGPVRVHRGEPNSSTITDLMARADAFVMPTRADCFGISTVEAMASGLPTIVGDVGAAREIVQPGRTGWLIEPTEHNLALAIEQALEQRSALPAMGLRAREAAEEKFDGERNDGRVLETIRRAHELFSAGAPRRRRSAARRAS
jgi:glycosyltransferase involved in cell wall biosynthesis